MAAPRVFLIDHSLQSSIGHHLEYSTAARAAFAKNGRSVKIYCHWNVPSELASKNELIPWFRETWSEKTRTSVILAIIWTFFKYLGINSPIYLPKMSFGRSLLQLIANEDLQPADSIFIHTLNFLQLVQIIQVIRKTTTQSKFHVVLRQDPFELSSSSTKEGFLKAIFETCREEKSISFYSDTNALCAEYERLSGLCFTRLPILFEQSPFPDYIDQQLNQSASQPRTPVVAFLGDGRIEKGFQFLPDIVKSTWRANPNIKFVFQTHLTGNAVNNINLQNALNELGKQARIYPNRLVLLDKPLSQTQYLQVLFSADIILIPYDASAYRLRSSGILAQSIAAGKTVIVPSNTSLFSDAAAEMGVDHRELCLEYESVRDVPELLAGYLLTKEGAECGRRCAYAFLKRHSSSKFVEALIP